LPVKRNIEEENIYIYNVSEECPLDYIKISEKTKKDQILKLVIKFLREGWPSKIEDKSIKKYYKLREYLSVDRNVLLYGRRVVIPLVLQKQVLELLHQDHPGIVRSKMLARSYIYWIGIDGDIEKWITTCVTCQSTQNKDRNKIYIPWPKSNQPWYRLHLDLLDFMQRKILLLIDEHSKWIEAWIMPSTKAETVVGRWDECFSRLGPPAVMVMDNGPPYQSATVKEFCKNRGTEPMYAPPYTPYANGLAEKSVQHIKVTLLRNILSRGKNLSLQTRLNQALFAIRNTPSSVTKKSPAEMIYHFRIRTKLSKLSPALNPVLKEVTKAPIPKRKVFEINEKVLVLNFSTPKETKWIPGRVMLKISSAIYLVKLLNGNVRKFGINSIKKSELENKYHPEAITVSVEKESSSKSEAQESGSYNRPKRVRRPPERWHY